jgi:cell division protein FtsW (lipid II flippase)
MGFGKCEGNIVVRTFFANPTEENFWLFARNQLYLPVANTWQNWVEFAFITVLPFSVGIVLIAIRLSSSFFVKWSHVKSGFLWALVQKISLAVILLLIVLRLPLGAASNIATIILVSLWRQCTGNGALFLFTLCAIALAFLCLLFLERVNR